MSVEVEVDISLSYYREVALDVAEDSSLSNFHSHFLYNKEKKNTILTSGVF